MRPKSIDQFAIVYGIIIVVGLIGTWLQWGAVTANESARVLIARFGEAPLYVFAGIGVLIQLLLWYFIVQRGSAVAKWIFVVLTALSLASGVFGLTKLASVGFSTMSLIAIAQLVLQAVAVWLLFRPDTPAWFGEQPADV